MRIKTVRGVVKIMIENPDTVDRTKLAKRLNVSRQLLSEYYLKDGFPPKYEQALRAIKLRDVISHRRPYGSLKNKKEEGRE